MSEHGMAGPQDLLDLLDDDPLYISPSAPLTQAIELIQTSPQETAYVLLGSCDDLKGLLTERDLLVGVAQFGWSSSVTVQELGQNPPVLRVKESGEDQALWSEWVQEQSWRFYVVLDAQDQVLGVLSRERLLQSSLQWEKQAKGERQGELQFRTSIEQAIMASVQDISAEEQILSQVQFQAEILAQINDAVIAIDTDLKVIYWNDKAVELYGYAQAEVLQRPVQEVAPYQWLFPEDEQWARNSLEESGAWKGEIIHQNRSGKSFYVEVSVSVLADGNGNQIGFLSVIRDISVRKSMEAELINSEEQRRLALELTQTSNWSFEVSTGEAIWSDSHFRLMGLEPRDSPSTYLIWKDRVHPEDLSWVERAFFDALETRSQLNVEYRIVYPDGKIRWVLTRGRGIYDEEGKATQMVGVMMDITERKQVESELQRQLDQTRLLEEITQGIHQSLDLQTIFDAAVTGTGRLIQVDQVTISRYQPDLNLWLCIAEYNAKANLPRALGLEIPDEGNTIAERLRQGQIIRVNDTSQISDSINQYLVESFPGSWLIIPIQISNKTWGSMALHHLFRQREWQDDQIGLAQKIVDQLALAIYQAQLFKQLNDVNSELTYQVEVRNAELSNMITYERLLRLITDDVRSSLEETEILQTAVQELTQVLNLGTCVVCLFDPGHSDQTDSGQTHYRVAYGFSSMDPSSGDNIPIDPSALTQLRQGLTLYYTTDHPLQGLCTLVICPIWKQDELFGFLQLVRPPRQAFLLQEIRLVEQVASQCGIGIRQAQLYQSVQQQVDQLMELNEMKEEFLNLVSHELRTPLTSMKMALTMLEVVGLTEPQSRYFSLLKQEWKKELDLVNNLLDLQRLESGKRILSLTKIVIQDWLQEFLDPFRLRCQEEQLFLTYHLPEDPLPFTTDTELLTRILSELLNNAIKYTPPQNQIQLNVISTSPQVRFQIINTGVEIPSDQLPHIFEKFHRVVSLDQYDRGGTGFALPLVKKGVELLEGEIEVNSQEGATCFCVVLPETLSQGE